MTLGTVPSFAQWNSSSSVNTPVCTGVANDQKNLTMGTDTKGGTIIVWADGRADTVRTDVYVQRLNSAGVAKWATNGIPICTDTSKQSSVAMTEDGNGGAIIAWNDYRNGYVQDIYAQKIDSTGNIKWTTNGVSVCSKAGIQKGPKLVSDGAGGAIIVWEDSSSSATNWDIYAQHINSSGAQTWTTGGVSICALAHTQSTPKIQMDGAGGALLVWQDKRNNVDYDIYAQRINAAGVVQWAASGVFVVSVANTQGYEKLKSDGQGGAYIVWQDKRNSALKNYDIYAQYVNAAGAMQWAVNGVLVCGYDSTQKAIDIVTYKVNGAIITWQDKRNGEYDVYAQKINTNGTIAWATDGILVGSGIYKQISPNVVSDGAGGAILTWQDSCCGSWDVKSQRVSGTGTLLWTAGGVVVANATNSQTSFDAVTDSAGGCIYSWQDYRSGTNFDVYAHHLNANGSATSGINEQNAFVASKVFPNPFSVSTVIELKTPFVNGEVQFSMFDLLGHKADASYYMYQNEIHLFCGDIQDGIYFYEVKINNSFVSKGKLILAH